MNDDLDAVDSFDGPMRMLAWVLVYSLVCVALLVAAAVYFWR